MPQLNFQIPKEINDFLEEMGIHEGTSKSAYAKKKLLSVLRKEMMPNFAELYKKGEISIKKISKILRIHPAQVIKEIADLIDDIEVEERVLKYSESVSNQAIPLFKEHIKNNKINNENS